MLANDATVAVLYKVRLCYDGRVLLLTNKSRVTSFCNDHETMVSLAIRDQPVTIVCKLLVKSNSLFTDSASMSSVHLVGCSFEGLLREWKLHQSDAILWMMEPKINIKSK